MSRPTNTDLAKSSDNNAASGEAARLRSFDFFDTLATRLVAYPADIFRIIEAAEGVSNFAAMRVRAEATARKVTEKLEVSLADIYEHIPIDPELCLRLQAREVELEQAMLVPVHEVAERFRAGDLILSDMYLGAAVLRDVWARHFPDRTPGAVLVSCDENATKSSGLLYDKISDRPGTAGDIEHVGDNEWSDVRQARNRGLKAVHYTGASLNRLERRYAKEGLDGSIVAGVMRATRTGLISGLDDPVQRAAKEIFSDVFAPALFCFSEWILDYAERNEIRDICFLARDGYVPWVLTKKIAAARKKRIKAHYIFGSRAALHLPGFETIDSAESWLLIRDGSLCLTKLAARAGLTTECVQEIARDYSISDAAETLEGDDGFGKAQQLIRDSRFVDALKTVAQQRREAAASYYRGVGLGALPKAALVDIGWSGSMQKSLESILRGSGGSTTQIHGLYFCLTGREGLNAGCKMTGFLAQPGDASSRLYDGYRAILEAAFSADHGTTQYFEFFDGGAGPILGSAPSPEKMRTIASQHAAYSTFADYLLRVESEVRRPVAIPRKVMESHLRRLLCMPTYDQALSFSNFEFFGGLDGGVEQDPEALVKRLHSWRDVMTPRALGMWQTGTLSLNGWRVATPLLAAVKRSGLFRKA